MRHVGDLLFRPFPSENPVRKILDVMKGRGTRFKRFVIVAYHLRGPSNPIFNSNVFKTLPMTELVLTSRLYSGANFEPKNLPILTLRRLFLSTIIITEELVDIIKSMPLLDVIVLHYPFDFDIAIVKSLFHSEGSEALRRRVKFMIMGPLAIPEFTLSEGKHFREVLRVADPPRLLRICGRIEDGTFWEFTGDQLWN